MYGYTRYKHVVVAVFYAAILLTKAGEFFVSNPHQIQVNHNTQVQQDREIPEHLPEKYETPLLKVLKVCKQKGTYTTNENHSVDTVCFVVSILRGGSAGNLGEISHRFVD